VFQDRDEGVCGVGNVVLNSRRYLVVLRSCHEAITFKLAQLAGQRREGFGPASADKILGLAELGLRSVVLLPLGHRDPSGDWLLTMGKVRKSLDTLVTRID